MTRRPDDLTTADDQGASGGADMAAQPSGPELPLHDTDEADRHGPSSAVEAEAGEIQSNPFDDMNDAGQTPSSAPTATATSNTQTEQEVREPKRKPIVWQPRGEEKK